MRAIIFSFLFLFFCTSFSLQANHDPEKKPKESIKNDDSYAKFIVYRPWKYTALLAPMHLHIDKKVKLSLPNNSKDTLYLAPGHYTLKRRMGDGWPERIAVEAGETYYVRITANLLGRQMEVVEPAIALQELTFHSYRRRGRMRVKGIARVRLD